MTKIKNNPLLKGASGLLGDTVVYRQYNGEVIMANRPVKIPITPHQIKTKERFMNGVRYAKHQMTQPEIKALYARKITGRRNSAYTVALTDFLNPPVIHAIFVHNYTGEPGSKIVVDAKDDFEVESVTVKIFDESLTIVEEGKATHAPSHDLWHYAATASHPKLSKTKIVATAVDRAGNLVTRELEL